MFKIIEEVVGPSFPSERIVFTWKNARTRYKLIPGIRVYFLFTHGVFSAAFAVGYPVHVFQHGQGLALFPLTEEVFRTLGEVQSEKSAADEGRNGEQGDVNPPRVESEALNLVRPRDRNDPEGGSREDYPRHRPEESDGAEDRRSVAVAEELSQVRDDYASRGPDTENSGFGDTARTTRRQH